MDGWMSGPCIIIIIIISTKVSSYKHASTSNGRIGYLMYLMYLK